MRTIQGKSEYQSDVITSAATKLHAGSVITLEGYVQRIRQLGGATFLLLRDRSGIIQVFIEGNCALPQSLSEGAVLRVLGLCRQESRAPGGVEVAAQKIEHITPTAEAMPFSLGKKELGLSLDLDLEARPISLRHHSHMHRFRLQACLVEGFRAFLRHSGFTEIFSPKLVAGNAEGGSNVFSLPYFGQTASLAQSPQLYKQMMVPVYGRVFETGHVYRAEAHNTSRHLNEYVSLDFEMGFIRSFEDIMQMELACLESIFALLKKDCAESLQALNVTLPALETVPVLHLNEALEMISEHTGQAAEPSGSLSAAQERQLCQAVQERLGSELVFVTHYSAGERPFYAMEDPSEAGSTLSFDLLMRGIEITTGGQRIHEYGELLEKMKRRGMDPEPFRHYLMTFKHGVAPHGGLGLGLERLTARLAGEENIRQGALFPRDIGRIVP